MSYVILVPLLPLLAALVIGVAGRSLRERSAKVGGAAVVAAFLGALVTLVAVSSNGPISVRFYEPASGTSLGFPVGFYIDRLSAVMMVLISGVSTIIYLFSMRYMQQERGYSRFLALLAFTTFVLLCMVSSANLLMLFIFWQLLTWLLYLLSHHYAHPATMEGAFKTYTLLRVGDVAFLSGIVLAHALYGTLEFQQLFIRAVEDPITVSLWPGSGLEISAVTAITLLIFIGAMSKSAQFPLHMWLPDSLYAPTPVHALLHAGIINAGGFLLNRLAPLYGLSPTTLHLVFAIGAMTALLGAGMMLTQNDIKKTLGYSTIGQMGYMIMECGLGASSLAILTLYRLRAVASRKVAALMLLTLLLVVSTYLLAVQAFTYFLYPAPGEVAAYFQAAALPRWLFDVMVGATALAVILGWVFIYAKGHGRSLRMPDWVNGVQTPFYLFFMNRLYVDALALRLGRGFTRVAHRLDTSRLFPYVAGLIALGLVLPAAVWTRGLSAANITLFFFAALLIPPVPPHGVYVAAPTRLPGYLPMCLAILLPTVGVYGLMGLLPAMPAGFL